MISIIHSILNGVPLFKNHYRNAFFSLRKCWVSLRRSACVAANCKRFAQGLNYRNDWSQFETHLLHGTSCFWNLLDICIFEVAFVVQSDASPSVFTGFLRARILKTAWSMRRGEWENDAAVIWTVGHFMATTTRLHYGKKALYKSSGFFTSWQRCGMAELRNIIHLDAVVMEVRMGQELIGGVVHVRGQQLTQKVAVDVRLGRHVVGEAKRVLHAHVPADSHFVNKEGSDFCGVQVL